MEQIHLIKCRRPINSASAMCDVASSTKFLFRICQKRRRLSPIWPIRRLAVRRRFAHRSLPHLIDINPPAFVGWSLRFKFIKFIFFDGHLTATLSLRAVMNERNRPDLSVGSLSELFQPRWSSLNLFRC